jgi:anaerobic selenocysteine-containing dehydrogenase
MATRRIQGFCALCRSRCGCVSVVDDGRLVAVEPDPAHPTGASLCVKGRAAPELVYAPDRLLYPMRRTRPKSDADAGWERISWNAALD